MGLLEMAILVITAAVLWGAPGIFLMLVLCFLIAVIQEYGEDGDDN